MIQIDEARESLEGKAQRMTITAFLEEVCSSGTDSDKFTQEILDMKEIRILLEGTGVFLTHHELMNILKETSAGGSNGVTVKSLVQFVESKEDMAFHRRDQNWQLAKRSQGVNTGKADVIQADHHAGPTRLNYSIMMAAHRV